MPLKLQDLTCRRGGRMVFQAVSLTVPDGQAALVRGPNGAGKSTVLRCLAGLIPAATGAVDLDGIDLDDGSLLQEQIAYAGHLDAVKPALTVRQNLGVWHGIFGGDAPEPALARFGLDAIAERPAGQCSAGQKRRLGLARLMVMRRKLWLLDEPTVSLDNASASLVAGLIRDHCAGGGIALVATHIDMDLGNPLVLQIEPAVAQSDTSDAFLAGDWA